MRTNNVVMNVHSGRQSYGFTMTFPSSTVLEIMARAGFDFVSFDSEHGPFTPESIDDLCRISDGVGITPMARVPDIEPATILRFLDRGIMGILGPHITTKEKAEQLADACRYAPLGTRSFGSGRGAYYGDLLSGPEYMQHTNANVIVMAQLEDIAVLDNLDEILEVPGIDFYHSGPQDIAQSLGLPGQPEHPGVKEFEETVRHAVHAAGKKMADEVMVTAIAKDLILDAAREFLEIHKNA